MHTTRQSSISPEVLSRSIDRFLLADGWLVTEVTRRADDTGYDVTLTKTTEPNKGRSVTRHARSAGEATLKACSSARLEVPSAITPAQ
ncbi:MAG TPA: hypothetical protein VD789_11100 [Thermomicrobiales bacterium]|nr:hypothetical protein [Thermomicrobiales bacterium]